MHAAVVRSFAEPPRYEAFPTPEPSGEHQLAVDVLAAGLHPRVRFVAFDGACGTMAERTVIDRRRAAVLREDANVTAIAAACNCSAAVRAR